MMHRFSNILIFFIFLIITLFVAQGCRKNSDEVCFNNKCFIVEIAKTPEERSRGLQFVENLCDDCGMLFIFPYERQYNFWMKDTLIPLDMVWLDSNFRVVYIKHNALPCKKDPCQVYAPTAASQYVVELNAGKALSTGIKIGDKMRVSLK